MNLLPYCERVGSQAKTQFTIQPTLHLYFISYLKKHLKNKQIIMMSDL